MKPSVLVVEDDEALCELLRWNLESEGYEVRTTPDGEEALVVRVAGAITSLDDLRDTAIALPGGGTARLVLRHREG